jgi:RNA polymerase sigma-70 factor (ECF subfamily)
MVKALGSMTTESLSPISDEELFIRYRDSAAPDDFNELVRRYERELFRYLARYIGNPTLAEDVFQNTFLQVHLKRGLYEDGRPVRPWLYSIATHQAVDALRKAGRHPTVSLDRRVNSSGGESDPGSQDSTASSSARPPVARRAERGIRTS